MSRRDAERRGRSAERIAAWFLRLKGWRVLAVRLRVSGGEIDLVARRGRTLAFVEVKARSSAQSAALSLDRHRLRRVAAAAEQVAPRFLRPGDNVRIDAIFVVPGRLPAHLPDVWQG